MGWYRTREAWALLVVISFVEPGLCIKPPRSACSGPQLFNGRVGLQQQVWKKKKRGSWVHTYDHDTYDIIWKT